jgi:hypothetical protein
MTRANVYQQVAAILETNSLDWTKTDNGGMYLRFASAGVLIELSDWGAQTLIEIQSKVLTELDAPSKRVLKAVNRLNMKSRFGRWVYYKHLRTIAVEYALLGDHLQEDELMTALAALARKADHHDDRLQRLLGGERAFED